MPENTIPEPKKGKKSRGGRAPRGVLKAPGGARADFVGFYAFSCGAFLFFGSPALGSTGCQLHSGHPCRTWEHSPCSPGGSISQSLRFLLRTYFLSYKSTRLVDKNYVLRATWGRWTRFRHSQALRRPLSHRYIHHSGATRCSCS